MDNRKNIQSERSVRGPAEVESSRGGPSHVGAAEPPAPGADGGGGGGLRGVLEGGADGVRARAAGVVGVAGGAGAGGADGGLLLGGVDRGSGVRGGEPGDEMGA